MHGPETRQSLLLRLRDSKHHDAWAEFVSIYEPLIYRVAKNRGLQHADAQDMTQEVFTVVGKAIGRFDPAKSKGSFRGWLSRITRNTVINFLTRDKESRGSADTQTYLLLQQTTTQNGSAEACFDIEYRRQIFRWAANRVKDKVEQSTWHAFWATAVEGKSIDEVAIQLGKSSGAIRIARCRVLTRLKEEAKTFDDENE